MNEETKEPKYLYGASVQGIQDFIFRTNKLKEIIGASELVAQICTDFFAKMICAESNTVQIIGAAGNIRCIFKNKTLLEKVVREFPRTVMIEAPGITINQAVVEIKGTYSNAANEIEQKLRAQRNKAMASTTWGLMSMKRAPSTGLPAVAFDKEELLDSALVKKRKFSQATALSEKAFGEKIAFPTEIEKLESEKSWIAVIHADGNNLGRIVQEIGSDQDKMKAFSSALDQVTASASQKAFSKVAGYFNPSQALMRPVILGGDDLTLICSADLALLFTSEFLKAFESESKTQLEPILKNTENLKEITDHGLTACAGIAFVKSSYPFHYAITLAENLCKRAKEKVKEIDSKWPPSCLLFHGTTDSYVDDLASLRKRTLTAQENISFEFGPYYCGENRKGKDVDKKGIEQLLVNTSFLLSDEGSAIKTHLRKWLGMLDRNIGAANQQMKRLVELGLDKKNKMNLTDYECLTKESAIDIPYYDLLVLASMNIKTETETKEKRDDIKV